MPPSLRQPGQSFPPNQAVGKAAVGTGVQTTNLCRGGFASEFRNGDAYAVEIVNYHKG
jgi:hypothetical protein